MDGENQLNQGGTQTMEPENNGSQPTLNNTIKSAIDKGNRLITEMYSSFRDSLYVLCRLNNININKEDITITFNIGRTDDDAKVSEICKVLTESKILSKATVREKYYGFNKEQSKNEDKQIELENSSNSNQNIKIDNNDDFNIDDKNKNNNKEIMEDKTNEDK